MASCRETAPDVDVDMSLALPARFAIRAFRHTG
jgi:hypothetical protein